jgi:hypothetical protein
LGGQNSKDIPQNNFGQRIFKREEYLAAEGVPLGSHSVCPSIVTGDEGTVYINILPQEE